MHYHRGLTREYPPKKIFGFLKEMLKKADKTFPTRGPINYSRGGFVYKNKVRGNIFSFYGREEIFYLNELIFYHNYIGGIVKYKRKDIEFI